VSIFSLATFFMSGLPTMFSRASSSRTVERPSNPTTIEPMPMAIITQLAPIPA
jgi:hypothetical protein